MIDFIYEFVKDALLFTRSKWNKYRLHRIKIKLNQAQKILCNSYLYDFFKWRYKEYPLLERCGKTYPVIIFPAATAQIYDTESVLGAPLERTYRRENDFFVRDSTFRRMLEQTGKKLENRPTFTLRSLNASGKVTIQCDLGYYYDGLDTCYALEWELLTGLIKKPLAGFSQHDFNALMARLPLREKTHLHCPDPVISGIGRSAFVGISALICYKDGDDYYLLLRKRSGTEVAVDTNMFHIIPSFVFQPATSFIEQEYSVVHNLKREYLEELFDRTEPEKIEGDYRYFYNDKRLVLLEKLITEKEADIYFTGVAINLLNLRPEVCLLLLIKSGHWNFYHSQDQGEENRFHFCAEWATITRHQGNPSELISRIPLDDTDDSLCDKFSPGKIAPAGAAALWLGLDLLRQLGIRQK